MPANPSPLTPRFSLRKPSRTVIEAFRAQNQTAAFSYTALGQSATAHPAGYIVDHNRTLLGHGEAIWLRARAALNAWKMFPQPWTAIEPPTAPLSVGLTLTMLARAFGLWWMNGCRIVYLVDDPAPARRYGFAYGTLTSHVEEGEERFLIEMLPDGSVWYDLRAFSRPRYWPVRLARPLARRLQRRFVIASQRALRDAIDASPAEPASMYPASKRTDSPPS